MSQYHLELRRLGTMLKTFDTTERPVAKAVASGWLESTGDAVILLWIDGKEIPLNKTGVKLGFGNKPFDSVERYSRHPMPYEDQVRHHSHSMGAIYKV